MIADIATQTSLCAESKLRIRTLSVCCFPISFCSGEKFAFSHAFRIGAPAWELWGHKSVRSNVVMGSTLPSVSAGGSSGFVLPTRGSFGELGRFISS